MNKKYVSIIVAVAILAIGYYWYSHSQSVGTQIQYKTQKAEKGTFLSAVSGSGNISVDQQATVDPTISGTVSNLAVKVGDAVKKGQVLFVIDNNNLSVQAAKSKSSYLAAEQSFLSAKTARSQAKADSAAAQRGNKKSPKQQINVLKKKVDVAEAGIISAEQSLAAAKADYNNQLIEAGKRTVTAPISGTINEINIKNGDDLGNLRSSNKITPIIIGDLGTLKAVVLVNEVDISAIPLGQKATLKLEALENFSTTGKVEAFDSLGTITQGVVTYKVTIAFDSLDPRFKPGMSVAASVITSVKNDVIMVPNSSVKTQSGKNYVEVLENGQPVRRPVEVGAANNTDTEIVSGVNVGDSVVTQTIDPNAKTTTSGTGGGFRLPGLGGR
jgi:HlyD family secretion protein